MKFHIVRNNETLEDILFLYNLTKDEIIEENRHIRRWDRLIPGTKLKIPPISEAVEQEVNDMEPFVEDYYPKLNLEDTKEVFVNPISDHEQDEKLESIDEDKIPPVEEIPRPKEKEIASVIEPYPKPIETVTTIKKPEEIKPDQMVVKIKPIEQKVVEDKTNDKKVVEPIHVNYQENNTVSSNINKPEQTFAEPVVQPYLPVQPIVPPIYLGCNNYPRYVPYSMIYYPVYLKK